jgi:hypothetical protein
MDRYFGTLVAHLAHFLHFVTHQFTLLTAGQALAYVVSLPYGRRKALVDPGCIIALGFADRRLALARTK